MTRVCAGGADKARALCFYTLSAPAWGQGFSQRGFVENQTLVYPQSAVNDSGQAVDSVLLRWEPSYAAASWLRLAAAFDARADTHEDTARTGHVDFDDRETLRPALSVRRLSAVFHKAIAATARAGTAVHPAGARRIF